MPVRSGTAAPSKYVATRASLEDVSSILDDIYRSISGDCLAAGAAVEPNDASPCAAESGRRSDRADGSGRASARSTAASSFDEPEADEGESEVELSVHLQRVEDIQQSLNRIRDRQHAVVAMLNCWPIGAMLVDESARPQVMNTAARKLLDLRDGIYLRHGRLVAETASATAALTRHLARTTHDQGGRKAGERRAISLERPSGLRPFSVVIQPLEECDGPGDCHASGLSILFFNSPCEARPVEEALLPHLYGLTPAEARLAAAIGSGLPLEKAAKKLGIKVGTARIHLKHIFSKTGASRQAELVRLLLSGPGQCGPGRQLDPAAPKPRVGEGEAAVPDTVEASSRS